MKPLRTILLVLVLCITFQKVSAHEIRPAYLEIKQTTSETYKLLWKVPGLGNNQRLGIYVILPKHCRNTTEPRTAMINSAFTERWTINCPGSLNGDTIRIAGLSGTMTDVLVRVEHLDGRIQTSRMTPSTPSFIVAAKVDTLDVINSYTVLGVEHILSGIDHLLFVLALLLITHGGWKLVKTVSAFTFSHTISLSLATLGYVHIPQKPVEAVIALSIVLVAVEILHTRQGKPGLTSKSPWIVALLFGLVHGLGFAGALSDVGLPQGHIPTALLFFSIGVEAGHFAFIGLILVLITISQKLTFKLQARYQQLFLITYLTPPYVIGSVAMFWLIQRIAEF